MKPEDYSAAAWMERTYAILFLIQDKFKSGNDIPVERIALTRAEIDAISERILK